MKPSIKVKVSKLDKNTYFIEKRLEEGNETIWEGVIKFRLLERNEKDEDRDVFIVIKEGYNCLLQEETESIKTLYRKELLSYLNRNNLGDRHISSI